MNYDFSAQQHQRHDNFDPYDILDIPRDSDLETIKQSFRRLTRVYHPDRNRGNTNYNPNFYSRICAAYETLSDPRQRASFDQQHAPSWNVLRESARSAPPVAAMPRDVHSRGGNDVPTKGQFTSGDAAKFNSAFEKNRKMNPNDKGYGDRMIARDTNARASTEYTPLDVHNVFGSSHVGGSAFNSRFETDLRNKRQAKSKELMERSTDEPLGWTVGGANSSAGFSDISVYDGIIVDRERDDFSKTDEATGLNYSDYMSGFETFTEQLPENHHYMEAANKDVERVYNERLAQLKQTPDRGHGMSFQQAEVALETQHKRQMEAEQQRNREMVLKYRDQYTSDDLLPSNSSRGRGGGGGAATRDEGRQQVAPPTYNPHLSLQHPQPQQPHQQHQQQQPHQRSNRRSDNGSAINNRMFDRQIDNAGRGSTNWQ